MHRLVFNFAVVPVLALSLPAQTTSKGTTPVGPTPRQSAMALHVQSDLLHLMRGIMYPASNVVFAAQNDDPADAKPAPGKDPSMATDPLLSTFGGWRAVESASLALAESANLLLIPGRKCANGVPVPTNNPDWAKFVQELRDAGMKAYEAAQSKNQDKMVEVADIMTTACANCHKKWREKPQVDRCK